LLLISLSLSLSLSLSCVLSCVQGWQNLSTNVSCCLRPFQLNGSIKGGLRTLVKISATVRLILLNTTPCSASGAGARQVISKFARRKRSEDERAIDVAARISRVLSRSARRSCSLTRALFICISEIVRAVISKGVSTDSPESERCERGARASLFTTHCDCPRRSNGRAAATNPLIVRSFD